MLPGETFGELERRLILVDVIRLKSRRDDASDAGRIESKPPLVRENVAFFVSDAVDPNAMSEHGALGVFDWRQPNFMPPRSRCATVSFAAKRRSRR